MVLMAVPENLCRPPRFAADTMHALITTPCIPDDRVLFRAIVHGEDEESIRTGRVHDFLPAKVRP